MKLNDLSIQIVRLCLQCLLASISGTAIAQPTCIPYGYGGAYAPGPPQWFVASGTGFARFNTWVDDPRWLGAASIDYGQGATKELQFRALFNPEGGANRFVYLSWWFKAALNPTTANNRLFVGLRSSSSQTGLLLRLEMANNPVQATASSAQASVTVHPVNANGTFGAALPSQSWTNDIRVWVNDYTDQTTHVPTGPNTPEANNWAVHVRVPMGSVLGNNVTLSSPFNMWFELLQGTPSAPVISYTWPRPTAMKQFGVTDPGGVEQLPATADWPEFRLGAGGHDTPCTGIEFEPTDIRVTHPPGNVDDGTIANNALNTLSATPTNLSGGDVPVDAVVARFRIANWGIQPNTADQADPTTGAWNTIGALGAVTQGPAGTNISKGSKWNISGTWTPKLGVPAEEGFFNGTRSSHQCVLVELSGPSNVNFLHNSAFRNMRIGAASTFTDAAEVSVIGLPPAATPQRDVYLYVQTSNMPAAFIEPMKARREAAVAPIEAARAPVEAEQPLAVVVTDDPRSPDRIAESQRERSAWERRMDSEPTYIVRGYFDTGRRLTIGGVVRPVLQPMVAFGYFIDHQGTLRGWNHHLTGAEQIGPNFYRVRPPNNGKVQIGVNIEALEKPRGRAANALWLDFGITFPHGGFANDYDEDLAANIGYEYAVGANASFEATAGLHLFEAKGGGTDVNVKRVAINGKWYVASGSVSPFAVLGLGAYSFDPGTARLGINVGFGAQAGVASHVSIEGRWTLHHVIDNAPNSTYAIVTAGLRYAF